ncbi:Eukaryotic elongation factor 5A hypusine, DNA-binding OB fold, putative [Angomonas deanei]|uniref:Eukaryotic elongation factor 5A hypusine, DNA-binding OB fold, putative n=1 Tax=Angomonas deanei TaxID=59799 RepID=A0A7G2CCN7_9TRYP|nr:Eukaryotic elongation factor 5A hypusine, DNA-binding OB fold, putative [Angomonas deanei]
MTDEDRTQARREKEIPAVPGGCCTYQISVRDLKKGAYVCVDNRPCKVDFVGLPPRGKIGNGKVYLTATEIFTGFPAPPRIVYVGGDIEVPVVKTATYSVIDIQPNENSSLPDHLSLMTEEGESREDLDLPPDATLAAQIKEQFEAGKEVNVVVVSAMGIEQVLSLGTPAQD